VLLSSIIDLQKKLSKLYEPSSHYQPEISRKGRFFKTDEKGNAVLLFTGKANNERRVEGDRYARVLKFDTNGNKIKDH
jgi:hypothetical protein